MKLTKIIATIGPSCEDEDVIESLIKKGVNVFRFNFKHNEVSWHKEMIKKVRKIASKLDLPIGTLIDLQGPEIRIRMQTDFLEVKKGELYNFEKELPVSHPQIFSHLIEGQKVVADDGAFKFELHKKFGIWYLEAKSSGILKNNKTLIIPGADFPISLLVERDFEGINLAGEEQVDFIALSFVRTADDIVTLRNELTKHKVKSKIASKIETQKAIENLDKIIEVSDCIMVARGDLGVEIPLEEVPYYQKKIIKKCTERGRSVITATQMLESMIQNSYPTRAEISDVANAVYDFTDALMLSAESAIGGYPIEAVGTMSKTVRFIEKKMTEDTRIYHHYDVNNQTELLCDAAYNLYHKSGGDEVIEAFVVSTATGRTARILSRYRPKVPVFAFTPDTEVATSLTINFGVIPLIFKNSLSGEKEMHSSVQSLIEQGHLVKGKKIIVLSSDTWRVPGPMSTLRVVTV